MVLSSISLSLILLAAQPEEGRACRVGVIGDIFSRTLSLLLEEALCDPVPLLCFSSSLSWSGALSHVDELLLPRCTRDYPR